MKPYLLLFLVFCFFIACSNEPETSSIMDTEVRLTELLHEFLDGATHSDFNIHNNFWADELIYTGSAGTRTTKSQILSGMDPNSRNDNPTVIYTGDQIQILDYGELAVVAFRLVAKDIEDETLSYFFNTGTFRFIDGRWQAVAWQATRIPD